MQSYSDCGSWRWFLNLFFEVGFLKDVFDRDIRGQFLNATCLAAFGMCFLKVAFEHCFGRWVREVVLEGCF